MFNNYIEYYNESIIESLYLIIIIIIFYYDNYEIEKRFIY